ncbi:MAG: hypothetical protein HY222_08585 [Thaumarchaeota archaeon]|nr:hypothetical protein [Nitrososphaerota archaeon]MBI3642429.1 hypothetical protein [Nitrososphaerota archaeon]
MEEFDEFALALLDQLSVEINEEKDITMSLSKATQALPTTIKFEDIDMLSRAIFPKMAEKVAQFTGISVPSETKLEFLDLIELKQLKGKKVFATKDSVEFVNELFTAIAHENSDKMSQLMKKDPVKFLVYSTYAKSYISKISTTYGDYLDFTIFLNKFVLSSYPQIILQKQGESYDAKFEYVNSGYVGALKMTILEEQIHAIQGNLQDINKKAVMEVNAINEELAKIILSLDDDTVNKLSEYLQLPPVPEEFSIARRANLFFMLNPDTFIVGVLGPDVMTFTKVTIDPKISEMLPQLLDNYQRWLKPIQIHHAAFSTMEGMAEFAVQNILKDDKEFQDYLVTFANTDISSYQVRKSMGMDFTSTVFANLGKDTYRTLIDNPPTTRELKNPETYLKRL